MVFEPLGTMGALSELQKEILRLKAEKNAVILAHNYQIEGIQRVADYIGDSLGLAWQAAETNADVIVFCGVHFMAETAKIINPEKRVVMPNLKAGCSLADGCKAEALEAYLQQHPSLCVVAYINCSAAVKALSHVICTSGNAKKMVERIEPEREILFVPDQNLGRWVAEQTQRKMRLWPGSCYVHALFSVRKLQKLRERFPEAAVVAHPECVSSVRELADRVCSTEKMIDFCREVKAESIIVITEAGMIHRLQSEVPGKTFIAGPTDNCACSECRYMKLNTLENLRDCLEHLEPAVELDAELMRQAREPIERMLEWSR